MKPHPITNLYLTQLLCPAKQFILIFAKIGYLGIKKIFDKNKVNYSRLTIVQASDLHKEIDVLFTTLDPNQSTIISFDAENMYPSIKYALVEEAIDYFSKKLNTDENTEIKVFIFLFPLV